MENQIKPVNMVGSVCTILSGNNDECKHEYIYEPEGLIEPKEGLYIQVLCLCTKCGHLQSMICDRQPVSELSESEFLEECGKFHGSVFIANYSKVRGEANHSLVLYMLNNSRNLTQEESERVESVYSKLFKRTGRVRNIFKLEDGESQGNFWDDVKEGE